MDSWVVRAEDLVGEQRTDPSLAWLVPQQAFWSDEEVSVSFSQKFSTFQLTMNRNQYIINPIQLCKPTIQVLVETPKKNFTVTNLSEFFMAYDEPNFAMMVEVHKVDI